MHTLPKDMSQNQCKVYGEGENLLTLSCVVDKTLSRLPVKKIFLSALEALLNITKKYKTLASVTSISAVTRQAV